MDLGLQGRTALISAASKGLGFGIARTLAKDGANVSICSRDEASISKAAARLKDETGADPLAMVCDVRRPESIQAWVEATVARFGKIDMVLVNAGGPPSGAFMDLTDAQWQEAFELTLMSSVRLIRTALPQMNDGGAILTITSSSIQEPIEKLGLSTVMRLGVAGLVKTLADELAPRRIRVNNIVPGRIDTERVAQLDQGVAQRSGITFEQARQQSLQRIPFRRLGTTDEFGAAAAFLLSPAASYITGATLRVDGGMLRSI